MTTAQRVPYSPIGIPLLDTDYQKLLLQSGIRREWIDRAGFFRVNDADGRMAVGRRTGSCAGILIPYFRPGEDRPREYCLRRDLADLEYGSDGKCKERGKYLFPGGRANIWYFVPGTSLENLADTSLPIIITEGVKKALALQQTAWEDLPETSEKPRYLSVGQNGVWGHRGRIGKENGPDGQRRDVKGTIPDLSLVRWRGRKVTILFDVNVRINESVRAARDNLSRHLRSQQALVYWFEWPVDIPESVNGIDDLLALAGPQRILKLIEASTPFGTAAKNIKVWNLAELRQAHFEASEPVIEDILSAGETIALIGRPKTGKSRLAQQLTIDVSRGHAFLGHAVSRPRRVLVLDLENRPTGARSRFMSMATPHEADQNVFIYVPETLAGNAVNLSTPEGIKSLQTIAAEFRPEVLIVDTWRLLLGGDENKTEVVVRGLKTLSGLRELLPSLSTILIHHVRKQQGENPPRLRIDPSAWVEAASGHYSFIGHVDACYGLEREVDRHSGEEIIVFGGVARNSVPRTLLLEDDSETLLFRVGEGEDALKKILTPAELSIWESLASLTEFSFSDALERSGTHNRKALSSTLRKGQSARMIDRGPSKIYRRLEPKDR